MTAKEMALNLLHNFIELQLENAALKAVLSNLLVDGKFLDWEPMVQQVMADKIVRDDLYARYAGIEKSILDSIDDHAVALALLTLPSKGRPN